MAPLGRNGNGDGKAWGWGPAIETRGLEDLFSPQEVEEYTLPRAGIDNLSLSSVDTFFVPDRGEFRVDFEGYFRVARDEPTAEDWENGDVYVNLVGLGLRGDDSELGEISVSLNPDAVSAGQTFAAGVSRQAAKCRIATAAQFEIPSLGATVFNKEPILLMNDAIESIPPVEDPNGAAHIYRLPLFNVDDPDGRPVAYLTSLQYTVGNYLTEEEAVKLGAVDR